MTRRLRRCGHAPGAISPEDRTVVDQFRAMLTTLLNLEPWTPGTGSARSIAVRVGTFVERAYTCPGDGRCPEMIASKSAGYGATHDVQDRHSGSADPGWLTRQRVTTVFLAAGWSPQRSGGVGRIRPPYLLAHRKTFAELAATSIPGPW